MPDTRLLVWVADRRKAIPEGLIQSDSPKQAFTLEVASWSQRCGQFQATLHWVESTVEFWWEQKKKKKCRRQLRVSILFTSCTAALTKRFMWSYWWGHPFYGAKNRRLSELRQVFICGCFKNTSLMFYRHTCRQTFHWHQLDIWWQLWEFMYRETCLISLKKVKQ